MTDAELKKIEARCEKATPGWRAGRPDMQSYTGDGTPMKNMYNDAIEKEMFLDNGVPEHQACVYGFNSIADTQFFAHARTDIPKLIAVIRELNTQMESYEKRSNAKVG